MKNHSIAIFLAAYLLFLAVTGGPPAGQERLPEKPAEAARASYRLESDETSLNFKAADTGRKLLAECSYRMVRLELANPEALSQEEAARAAQVAETFNEKMDAVLQDCLERAETVRRDASSLYKEGMLTASYSDCAETAGQIVGSVVSVRVDWSSYTGGAHPNRYTTSYIFDLVTGQFLDPAQLAGDPEAFRTGVAALLQEKAAVHPKHRSFWQDYADALEHWNEGAALYHEDGLTVVFSPYELGPYAIGEVELRLTAEELAPLLGEVGMEHLGYSA